MSHGEEKLAMHLAVSGMTFERQYRFAPPRRWLADFASPAHRLIVEVDGGIWTNGRHTRGSGRVRDMERDNWCALNGWRVLRFTPAQVDSGQAILTITLFVKELEAAHEMR